jgi:hypothetical protein
MTRGIDDGIDDDDSACAVCGERMGTAEWTSTVWTAGRHRHSGCREPLADEQRRHLAGLPERMVRNLTLIGTEDDALVAGIFNVCMSGGLYCERTLAPQWVEVRIWRVKAHPTPDGTAKIHPANVPGGYDHDGPPDYQHRVPYTERYAGTALAAHAALWLLASAKEAH